MKRMTSPDRMKRVNAKRILKIVHEHPGICRKEIAEMTELSSQTVTNLVTELVEKKILIEYCAALGIKGRNPVSLRMNYAGFYMMSVDVNIEKIAVYINAFDETILCSGEQKITAGIDVLAALKALLVQVKERAGATYPVKVCVISVTGVVNEDRGVVIEAGKMNWYNLELVKELEFLEVPVILKNDVNLIAAYEKTRYREDVNFMVAKIDVGIGSSFVLGKHVLGSTNNVAGELGHVTVFSQEENRTCVCGKSNCLTKFISLEALEMDYGKTYEKLVEDVGRKEPRAVAAVERICSYLAPILANAIILLDLDRIILCGISMDHFESILYPCLDQKIRELLSYWVSFKRLEIHSHICITEISAQFLLDHYLSSEDMELFGIVSGL